MSSKGKTDRARWRSGVRSGPFISVENNELHGLIAGATGTGQTQDAAGHQSSSAMPVPVLLMDIGGDLSGIAAAGAVNGMLNERTPNCTRIGNSTARQELPEPGVKDEMQPRANQSVSLAGPGWSKMFRPGMIPRRR